MTKSTYEFTAFSEDDFNAGNIQNGSTFTMPGSATTCFEVCDDDAFLSGDAKYNENADDGWGQEASITGANGSEVGNGGQIYAEKWFWVSDQNGNWYQMVEIEQEGSNEDYFTFFTGGGYGVPPEGAQLTVHSSNNVTHEYCLDYKCLDAGEKEPETGNVCGRLTHDADCNDNEWNDETGTWDEGIGGKTVQLIDANGNVFAETTTRDDGFYIFENVPVGDYRVQFPKPDGYEFSAKDSGVDDHYDSDADENGLTDVFHVGADQWVDNVDAGLKKDVPPPDPECIIIEAEDFNLYNFKVVHGDQASGGELVKLHNAQGNGDIWTKFDGPDGCYNLTVVAQDESDGQSTIMVKINGEVVGTITLDQDSDGGGSDNGGFSEFTLENIQINDGDTITLWVDGDDGGHEFARIDKIILKPGVKFRECDDPNAQLLDFEFAAGTVVSDQYEGVTIEAQRNGDGPNSQNDAMVFDSANPTGGDSDLATTTQGGVLIISEDNDSSDPDDNAGGGTFTFTFDAPSFVHDLIFIDTEEPAGTVELFDANGDLIASLVVPVTNDGGIDQLLIDTAGVSQMVVTLAGSGAIDHLCYVPPTDPQDGSIEGRYFIDQNDNSLDDAEPGVEGVMVTLLNADGSATGQTTTTGANGEYSFAGLAEGNYIVEFAADPSGRVFVEQDAGDDAIDSDADPVTGRTDPISVGVSQAVMDVDAGVEDPRDASITGRAFIDTNDDSLETDANGGVEAGLGGIQVALLNGDGSATGISTTTLDDGSYTFSGLAAGDYIVEFGADGAGRVLVDQDAGDDTIDSDAAPADGRTDPISVAIGQAVSDVDAGYEDPANATIAGRYFIDQNDNDLDDSEPGVEGVTVTLLDDAGNPTGISTTTGAGGEYQLTGVPAGSYIVQFDADPSGRSFVAKDAGDDTIDSDADPATGRTDPISVTIGQSLNDVDAGVEEFRGSISGRYFCDTDANNVDDGDDNGEFGVGNAVVMLMLADGVTPALDDNGNPITTTTDFEFGEYRFDNLLVGNYVVKFALPTDGKSFVEANFGNDPTIDSDVIDPANGTTGLVTVLPATETADVDAGIRPNDGSVTGRYFIDSNGDSRDDGEPAGIGGVSVTLVTEAGAVAATTTTNADGTYSFGQVFPGRYAVVFDADPAGRSFVTPDQGDDIDDSDVISTDGAGAGSTALFDVGADQDVENVDAGVSEFRGSISGRYFCDNDGNGVDDGDDAGELGIGGSLVMLMLADGVTAATDENGNAITATTDFEFGEYRFDNLIAGDYVVKFAAPPDGKEFTDPNAGNDPAVDSDVINFADGTTGVVTVAPAAETMDVDAGIRPNAQGVNVSGEIVVARAATQTVTFIIDHSLTTFTNDADLPPGYPGEDLNGDGSEAIFDDMLRQIVERAKSFDDDTQEFHIILTGFNGVVAEETYTVGDIKTADANGTLGTLFGAALNPTDGFTELNVAAGLTAAQAFITSDDPNGGNIDEIVILTTTDSLFQDEIVDDNGEIILGDIIEIGGPSTGPGTAFEALTDANGINARINAVIIDSGVPLLDTNVLDNVDEDGVADQIDPGDDMGLGTLVTIAMGASAGTVVTFTVELDGTPVAGIDATDLTPDTQMTAMGTQDVLILAPTAIQADFGSEIDIVLGIDNVNDDGIVDQTVRLSDLQPGLDRILDQGETVFDFLIDLV